MTAAAFAPQALVDATGKVVTGIFNGSPARVNGRDFDYRTPMGEPRGALAKHFHYKQFQYFGVLSGDLLAGCALADTAFLGLAFVYVYDTRSRRMVSETFRLPLARGMTMSESPRDGESRFVARGVDIRMHYRERADGTLEKSLAVKTARGLRIEACMHEAPPFEVLALCTQTGINGWTYANKVAGLPVEGRITCALGNFDLASLRACGHHDFSAGYMRRETFWNWACLSGQAGGHTLGLNLSCGVNETSHSENCLWLDGARSATGLTRFDYNRAQPEQPWHITTSDAGVDLVFTPAGLHAERLDLGLFATNFKQFFGQFSGTLRVRGESHAIDGLWGFVEEQYARW